MKKSLKFLGITLFAIFTLASIVSCKKDDDTSNYYSLGMNYSYTGPRGNEDTATALSSKIYQSYNSTFKQELNISDANGFSITGSKKSADAKVKEVWNKAVSNASSISLDGIDDGTLSVTITLSEAKTSSSTVLYSKVYSNK